MVRGLFLSTALLFLIACSADEQPLATYEGGNVTQGEFLMRYENYLVTTGLKDNLPDRKKLLRSAVHEELILMDWHGKNLDELAAHQHHLKLHEDQAILDAWREAQTPDPGDADPQVLARMLINEKTKYHIRESKHANLQSANNFLSQVQAGASPEFSDLGYISLEDVHPRLSRRLVDLKAGEVTSPIRMGDGYALLQLVDKKIPPMIRPQDFAAARERLTLEWQVNHIDSVMNAYTAQIVADLNIAFNQAGLNLLLTTILNTPQGSLLEKVSESELANTAVCSTVDGEWSIESLAPHIQDTDPRQFNVVQDANDLRRLVSGVLVRQELLKMARKEGIDKEASTMKAAGSRKDLWRIKQWQELFADTVTIDRQYIADASESALADTNVIFRNVIVMAFDERGDALSFQSAHKNDRSPLDTEDFGEEFAPDLQGGGNLGWISASSLGQATGVVFGQPLLKWTEPWQYNGRYFLFNSLDERTVQISEDEQIQEIEARVRMAGAPVQLEEALSRMEKKYAVKIYDERIKEIPYIQSSGTSNES